MRRQSHHQQQQLKRIKTITTTTSLKDLPEEIINEILLRIPADDLVQHVKLVSKLWCRLISDQKFVRAHLNRNCHQWEYQHIIFSRQHHVFNLQQNVHVEKFNFADLTNNPKLIFRYCSDGLFLFESIRFDKLYICNPATDKCTTLTIQTSDGICVSDWILTHDDSVKKYKVVGLSSILSHCYIYTPHSNNGAAGYWSELLTGYEDSECISTPTLLNQELHWLATSILSTDEKVILCSMDVSKEEFRGTQVPFLKTISWGKNTILEVMGSFCLTDYCYDRNLLEIWTSLDKGKGNWTKIHSITCNFEFDKSIRPHFSCSQTKFLVSGNNQVFLYDLKYKDWKRIDFPVHEDMVGEFVYINSIANWAG